MSMITEADFRKLYAWATGDHEGFTCPFCKQDIPPGEKHVVHLTPQDATDWRNRLTQDVKGSNYGECGDQPG